ncbi:MAG: Cu(I)-responsive transcriptional regulator [Pseudomonadota bacterium]|uniref:Cu(I)-responsive transcriptional regulator n=1 Tax=unclassified Phenylobacterium TaxID=2640670 RepID=UPI0006F236BF|nr:MULTISPECIES: Cu(I)-responsive transcriptional regulator [unclassified Phenylobacterium]KRB52162.1 MerR family transcriptional regulator [Phenylobacterium sp. Root700]MBT9472958.1 Cu(I)-responsive transcriptional regulator [Phenylobacterium sp.]
MNIGQASKASGVSTKMIRYYDEIGLVRPASRTESNYREFDEREINELRFIRRARSLGFSMPEITQLLSLWRDRERPSREVKAIAQKHLGELDARIAEMQTMADTLRHLSHCCAGDDRPDCPILADLTGGAQPAEPKSADVRRR